MKYKTNEKAGYPRNYDYSNLRKANETDQRIVEEELIQSQSLEEIRALVGGIAHDINNVLNVITGHVSLMERWRTDPERFMKSFHAVKKATERGATTARQLLNFARDAKGSTGPVDVGEVIREIERLLKDTLPENIILDIEINPGIPALTVDSKLIRQALLSLCMSARDAMPEGGTISIVLNETGSAHVSTYDGSCAEHFVQVTVSDTRCGVGSGSDRELSIVRAIVKACGGFIESKMDPDQGASFSMSFPLPTQGPEKRTEEVEKSDQHETSELILAIEDEEPLKDFLRTVLTGGGYRVLLASNGLEGLQTYRDHMKEISLVLLDMGLPEMSGTEVLTGLLMLNPYAKVISAGGYLDRNVEVDALEIGALAFLPKPYMADELLTKVHQALHTTR